MNKPKVSNFELEIWSNQNVFQFHVKMSEILAVEEVKSLKYKVKLDHYFLFIYLKNPLAMFSGIGPRLST